MNKNEMFDFAEVIGKAFELLGFDAENENEFKESCKEKACQCKENIVKKIEEKREDIKRAFKPLVNLSNTEVREHLDGGKYVLQIVATGFDETMVKIKVNPNEGTLTVSSELDIDSVWYMPNINMTVNLPDGIDYRSLKKDIKNGLITITGNVEETEERNVFDI